MSTSSNPRYVDARGKLHDFSVPSPLHLIFCVLNMNTSCKDVSICGLHTISLSWSVSNCWIWLVAAPKLSGIIIHRSPTPFEGIVVENHAHIMLIFELDRMGSWTPAVQRRLCCIAHSSDLWAQWAQWARCQSESIWEQTLARASCYNFQNNMLQFATIVDSIVDSTVNSMVNSMVNSIVQ